MSERVFGDARSQHEAIVSVLADDPYVTYVIESLESKKEIDHPVTNWKREMIGHLLERYDVSLNIAHAAISKSRANFRQQTEVITHVHEA